MTTNNTRRYTSKQMGDACEMLVAAELTLAGVPALKVPDMWPDYDIIAQPLGGVRPQRISVKSRTYKRGAAFVEYNESQSFDWLAIVILKENDREIFVVPRAAADLAARRDKPSSKTAKQRYFRIDEVEGKFQRYISNFGLEQINEMQKELAD